MATPTRIVILTLVGLLLPTTSVWGGGWRWSWWERSALPKPYAILSPPPLTFEYLLRAHPAAKEFVADPFAPENWCWQLRDDAAAELGDLRLALESKDMSEDQIESALAAYHFVRSEIRGEADSDQAHQRLGDAFSDGSDHYHSQRGRTTPKPPPTTEHRALLPREFLLYLDGAREFRAGNAKAAAICWEELLALPAAKRHYRSVWASWMLGKCEENFEVALKRFQETVDFAEAGFADSLGLSRLAMRWLAGDYLEHGDHRNFFRAHFAAMSQGSERSLADLHRHSPGLENIDREVTRADPLVAYLAFAVRAGAGYSSFGGEPETLRFEHPVSPPRGDWGEPLLYRVAERSDRGSELSGTLAMLAYSYGNAALTKDLLARAPLSPPGRWVAAKLAIAHGDHSIALEHLEKAAHHFRKMQGMEEPRRIQPATAYWGMDFLLEAQRRRFFQDLATMRLSEDDFAGAALAFIDGRSRRDAAHVLQNLMSVEESAAFADAHFPNPTPPARYGNDAFAGPADRYVRRLVGARLAVEGKHEAARRFFDPADRELYDRYLSLVRDSENIDLKPEARAEALWDAAQLRQDSPHLFAVMEPPADRTPADQWPALWRLTAPWPECLGAPPHNPEPALIPPTAVELNRLRQFGPLDKYRGFPRYDAARMAIDAAALLGDNSPRGAEILNAAGGWVRYRNPVWANSLYRRLATRYTETELGRAAAEKRWFPN